MEIKERYEIETKTLNLDYDSLYKIISTDKVDSKFIKKPLIFVENLGLDLEEMEILEENSPFKLNIFKNNEKICTISRCRITVHHKTSSRMIIKPLSKESCIGRIETQMEKIDNKKNSLTTQNL